MVRLIHLHTDVFLRTVSEQLEAQSPVASAGKGFSVSLCNQVRSKAGQGLVSLLGGGQGPALFSSPLASHVSLFALIIITFFLADAVLITFWEYLFL